jgi:hypothetical protein
LPLTIFRRAEVRLAAVRRGPEVDFAMPASVFTPTRSLRAFEPEVACAWNGGALRLIVFQVGPQSRRIILEW